MNTRLTMMSAAVAGLLVALALPALSQGGFGPGMGPRAGAMMGSQPEFARARIDTLRNELKLAPNQTAAFDAWAARVQSEAEARAQFRAQLRAQMQSRAGDPQAMSEFRVTMARQRAEAAQELHTLRTSLYAQLTPQQKQVFDRFGPGAGLGPRFGGGRGCGWA